MPWKAAKHCPAGHAPFQGSRCPRCDTIRKAASKARNPSPWAHNYGGKWRRESKAFLALPGNTHCACGCGQVADMVDHRIAHKGDVNLFWSRSNWQPMNRRCNSRKAAATEGGFGNAIKQGGGDFEF